MKIKAIIDFTTYKAAALTPVAQAIHDRMSANAAIFPSPTVGMAALQTLITAYMETLAARAGRASADVLAWNLARRELEAALHGLGGYVNLVAKGDAVIVEKSGFPSHEGAVRKVSAIPAAPENVRLRNGELSGTVALICKPDRSHSHNVAQITEGDPNDEAGWRPAAHFNGGRTTIGDLTVGRIVWVRIATVGVGGVLGPWSDPAKIVVQ